METICGQANHFGFLGVGCFVYDFQTLLTGVAAIAVAVVAGVPVWRQLRDTNLQTRISHRETLALLLRDASARYERVDQSISKALAAAVDVTTDPMGEFQAIDPHDAHGVGQMFNGVLDWYLITLAETERADIERCKSELKNALDVLEKTLNTAHWAEHNFQSDEDHDYSDQKWAEILAECEEAKIQAAGRVAEVGSAYRALGKAQGEWMQSLRSRLAKLDLQISGAGKLDS